MKLRDRVAVITGAGSGIGRACAIEFAREGAAVGVVDIDLATARETVRLIENAGGSARAFKTDVSRAEEVQRLVVDTSHAFQRIDALVNNAAVQVNKTVEDTT